MSSYILNDGKNSCRFAVLMRILVGHFLALCLALPIMLI